MFAFALAVQDVFSVEDVCFSVCTVFHCTAESRWDGTDVQMTAIYFMYADSCYFIYAGSCYFIYAESGYFISMLTANEAGNEVAETLKPREVVYLILFMQRAVPGAEAACVIPGSSKEFICPCLQLQGLGFFWTPCIDFWFHLHVFGLSDLSGTVFGVFCISGPVWTTCFCCSCVLVCQCLDVCVLRYPYDPMM